MRSLRNRVALPLVVSLLLILTLSVCASQGVEDDSRRTWNTKVFRQDDGLERAEIHLQPVHYKDALGKWQDIETLLLPDGGEAEFTHSARKNTIQAFFHKNKPVQKVKVDGYSVTFEPIGARNVDATISGNRIEYPGVWPSADLRYLVGPGMVKEEVVLHDLQAPKTYSFQVKTNGLNIEPYGAGLVLTDDSGNPRIVVKAPYLIDAEGNPGQAWLSIVDGQRPEIVITLDEAWLADPSRKFPVVLDPNSTWTSGYPVQDTYTSSYYWNSNFGSSAKLQVGQTHPWFSNWVNEHTYLQWDIQGLRNTPNIQGASVVSATVRVWNYRTGNSAYFKSGSIAARKILSSWSEGAVTHGNSGSISLSGAHSTISPANNDSNYAIDVPANPQWVTDWLNGEAHQGIAITNLGSYDHEYLYHFRSSEYTDTGYSPRLIIVYNRRPTITATSPINGILVDSLQPRLTWSYFDPEGTAQSKFQVQLSKDNFATIAVDSGLVTSSIGQWTPPTLSADSTYYWRVKVIDSDNLESAWSPTVSFRTKRRPSASPSSPVAEVVDSKRPTFRWTYADHSGKPQKKFLVEIYRDSALADLTVSSGEVNQTVTSGGQGFWIVGADLTPASYHWRVKVWDTGDVDSNWSSAQLTRNSAAYKRDGSTVSSDTSRFETGRFGSAITIEEGTYNLTNPDPRQYGVTDWSSGSGATTTDGTTPWGLPYRGVVPAASSSTNLLLTSPAFTLSSPAGKTYAGLCAWKASSGSQFLGLISTDGAYYQNAVLTKISDMANGWKMGYAVFPTIPTTYVGTTSFQLLLRTSDKVGTTLFAMPQLEAKAYATSWTSNTRASETLTVSSDFVPAAEGTVEGWFYLNDLGGHYSPLFTTADVSAPTPRLLLMREFVGADTNRLRVWESDGVSNYLLTGITTLQSKTWYHFALSWSPQGRKMYLNGNLEASNTQGFPIAVSKARLGSWKDTHYLNGYLDDVRISRIARTDAEIAASYQNGQPASVDRHTTYKLDLDGNLDPEVYPFEIIPPPLPIDPSGGEMALSMTPTLSWSTDGAVQKSFRVLLSTDSGFTNPIDSGTIESASTIWMTPRLTEGQTYFWKVQISTPSGATSSWSAVPTFKAPDRLLGSVTINQAPGFKTGFTGSSGVQLSIDGGGNTPVASMRFANQDPSAGGVWLAEVPFGDSMALELFPGEGERRVWMQLVGLYGNLSDVITSQPVTVDLFAPTAPANVRLAGTSQNVPTWAWDPSTDTHFDGYEIRVGTKSGLGDVVPGPLEDVRAVGPVTTWQQDVPLPFRGEYYVQVRAVDRAGRVSPWAILAADSIDLTWAAGYSFDYDDTGNRRTQSRFGQSYAYDHTNSLGQQVAELTKVTQGLATTSFEYDDAGNLTKRTQADEVWEYEYDADNRLATVYWTKGASPKTWVAKYEYDSAGLRIRTVEKATPTSSGRTIIHVYEGLNVVYEEVFEGITDITADLSLASPTKTISYLFAAGQRLGKAETQGGTTAYYYFVNDRLGSTRVVTDDQGNVVARMQYEPFGGVLDASGAQGSEAYKYTGKPWDGVTGLYYYGARFYDPAVGRFITADSWTNLPDDERGVTYLRDPLLHNRYTYVANNPVFYTDPTGHKLAVGSTIENEDDTLEGQHVWTGDADYDVAHAEKGYEGDQREAYAGGRRAEIAIQARADYNTYKKALSAGDIGATVFARLVSLATSIGKIIKSWTEFGSASSQVKLAYDARNKGGLSEAEFRKELKGIIRDTTIGVVPVVGDIYGLGKDFVELFR